MPGKCGKTEMRRNQAVFWRSPRKATMYMHTGAAQGLNYKENVGSSLLANSEAQEETEMPYPEILY